MKNLSFVALCLWLALPGVAAQDRVMLANPAESTSGMVMNLKEVEHGPAAVSVGETGVPAGQTAPTAETLFKGLPDIMQDTTPVSVFSPKSLPPPKPNQVIDLPLSHGSEAPPEAPVEGPLRIVRFAPVGPVVAPQQVSLSFSHAMVPLTDIGSLASEIAEITPAVKGSWRWVSPASLVFESPEAFPPANLFEVSVKNLQALQGQAMAEPFVFSFSTPPPHISEAWPGAESVLGNDPLICLVFDQEISPSEVAQKARLTSAGGSLTAQLASSEEVEALYGDIFSGRKAQQLAFLRFKGSFPKDSAIRLTLGQGLSGQSGPLKTVAPMEVAYRSPASLALSRHAFDANQISMSFSNSLAVNQDPSTWVTVVPAVDHLSIQAYGDRLVISGDFAEFSEYKVTLSASITDAYGQQLGKPETISMKSGLKFPILDVPGPIVYFGRHEPCEFVLHTQWFGQLHVQYYKVEPSDWPAFQQLLKNPELAPPGRAIGSRSYALSKGTAEGTTIDVAPYLGEQGMVLALFEGAQPRTKRQKLERRAVWIQRTQIAVDLIKHGSEVTAWVTELKDASPLQGAEVSVLGTDPSLSEKHVTDAKGLATLPVPSGNEPIAVLVRQGADQCIVQSGPAYEGDSESVKLIYYITDDRGLYRPGEEVHIGGWVRLFTENVLSNPTSEHCPELTYTVLSSAGQSISKGDLRLSPSGRFSLSFKLPEQIDLGQASFSMDCGNEQMVQSGNSTYFNIQDFRTPEYKVELTLAEGQVMLGDDTDMSVVAEYYAGGALSGTAVRWSLFGQVGTFAPPGHDGYRFGNELSWEGDNPMDSGALDYSGMTNAMGRHSLSLNTAKMSVQPHVIQVTAAVQDINNQEWSDSKTLLVHPAELYIGLRGKTTWGKQGTPYEMSMIVADLNGQLQDNYPVEIEVTRRDRVFQEGSWQAVEQPVSILRLRSTGSGSPFSFPTAVGGEYLVRATLKDKVGRVNETRLSCWVSGEQEGQTIENEVTLTLDKESYQPGDRAQLMVKSAMVPAQGLLLVRQGKIIESRSFQLKHATQLLELEIDPSWLPGARVLVVLSGQITDEQGQPETHTVSSSLDLAVPPEPYRLHCRLNHAVEAQPGERVPVDIFVEDANGAPAAAADVVLIAVDEAVLASSGKVFEDPLAQFYPGLSKELSGFYFRTRDENNSSRSFVFKTASVFAERAIDGASNDVSLRANFSPLAAFVADGVTDAGGRWSTAIQLPDNLTRYRIIALVAQQQKFGKVEQQLTASLPLMVRPSAPRFLNMRDRFELPVVVQNMSDQPADVAVAVRARGLKLDQTVRRVRVPAQDRVRVLFSASAPGPGLAQIQVVAQSATQRDAAEISFPIYRPSSDEAFAINGHLDEGALMLPLEAPEHVLADYGGLEVTYSSTALSGLAGAAEYLSRDVYQCSEQLASQILGLTALSKLSDLVESEGQKLQPLVQSNLTELAKRQCADGGFSLWSEGEKGEPFLSVHVGHALLQAREAGWQLPGGMLDRALAYLKGLDQIEDVSSQDLGQVLAYAASVLGELGATTERLAAIHEHTSIAQMSPEMLGWLLPLEPAAVQAKMLSRLDNLFVISASSASIPVPGYLRQNRFFHSEHRGEAVVLEGLIQVAPDHPLIGKLAAGLMASTTHAYPSRHDLAFTLPALAHYFETYETEVPNFRGLVWLGERLVGESFFLDRETLEQRLVVPMQELLKTEQTPVTLGKEGFGRLYYRMALSYAPSSLSYDPLSSGFFVARRLEPLDDPKDLWRDKTGLLHIREGARIRIVTTVTNLAERNMVALAVPLPAGFESISAAQEPAQVYFRGKPSTRILYPAQWFEHEQLRSERAEVYASSLNEGVHTYSLLVRATTPGEFSMPPARAEEMYHPETFGRSGSERLRVVKADEAAIGGPR